MSRFKLKDRERQKAYETWLRDFDHHLQIACEGFDDEEDTVVLHHLCKMTDKPLIAWELTISKTEIEDTERYNPNRWNEYPKVTPPGRVLMQVEGRYTNKSDDFKGALTFSQGHWYLNNRYQDEAPDNIIVERFRPWDDKR